MREAFHIHCDADDIGHYVLLPGDPGRVKSIATRLENPRQTAHNREYLTYTGTLDGVRVSVTSTGIGAPSAAIALEELAALGAHTFIRVGTCGGISPKVQPGDTVIASAACRQEGLTREYAPVHYPAVSDYTVLRALSDAAATQHAPYHIGVVQSKDSFYGQHEPERMPVAGELLGYWEAWKRLGVLASEMEASALFVVGAALGVRCGAVLQVFWNQDAGGTENPVRSGTYIDIAVEAIRILARDDRDK